MFCPNCGNIVSKDDNYCTLCGKKLKNIKISVENLEDTVNTSKTTTKESTKDVTRIFNPHKLDGIDTTDDIKNIIAAVDKKISKNIRDYENRSNTLDDIPKVKETKSAPIIKKDSPKKDENLSKKTDVKESAPQKNIKSDENSFNEFKMSEKELVRRVQEELKRNNFSKKDYENSDDSLNDKKSEAKAEDKNKKKTLKDKWKDFINEDDDEFSIFNDLKKDKSLKTAKERDFHLTNTEDYSNKSIEQTLSVPKITTENEKFLDKIVSKEKRKNKAENKKINNSSKENDKVSPKNHTKSKFWNNEKIKSNIKEEKIKLSKLKDNIEDDFKEKHIDKIENVDTNSFLLNNFKRFSVLNLNFSDFLKNIKSNESLILLGLGILLIFVPMFIGQGKLSFNLIFFLLLKLVFDYIQFSIPLKVAKEKTNLTESSDRFRINVLINWFYTKILLFIGYIITPMGGFFQFNLLKAMTPMPIATIIIILLSPIIALGFYYRDLEKNKIIDFVGWYSSMFILFELIFKLSWFGLNFIFNTLF